jgi:hypothetical protein
MKVIKQLLAKLFMSKLFNDIRLEYYHEAYQQGKFDEAMEREYGKKIWNEDEAIDEYFQKSSVDDIVNDLKVVGGHIVDRPCFPEAWNCEHNLHGKCLLGVAANIDYENSYCADFQLDESKCEYCGEQKRYIRELYGEDADGNRGEWREYYECAIC